MTLVELGKPTDLDFDQNFENWPPIDPPSPPNVNLTPHEEIFIARNFLKLFYTSGLHWT